MGEAGTVDIPDEALARIRGSCALIVALRPYQLTKSPAAHEYSGSGETGRDHVRWNISTAHRVGSVVDDRRPVCVARQMAVKKPFIPFIGYLSFFYLAWALVWVHRVYPWATRTIGDATLIYAFINIAFRLLIWVLPVLLYLRYLDRVSVWEYLQLKQYWRRGVIVGLTISVINFLGMTVRIGQPAWGSAHITWNSILGTSLLVGVFEEVPFRGFVLQKLQERWNGVTSTVISSILFVGAHIPGWVMLGSITAYKVLYIFVFGAVMAIIFRYSKSLWAPIITHSLNDGLSSVIFHI
jgi:membrane protease YdiL (CAAX protease family)